LYESTCFAADNNALELRSLARSGPSKIPAVKKSRQAFLDQALIKARALSDQFLFDGDATTTFDVFSVGKDFRLEGGALRVDFGQIIPLDHLTLKTQALDRTLIKLLLSSGEFSQDLIIWTRAEEIIQDGLNLTLYPPKGQTWRYFRMKGGPESIAEIEAWHQGKLHPREGWRASNLFSHPEAVPAVSAWSSKITVDEITPTSYLCLAVEGQHGVEGCYAALRMGDRLIGAPNRAASYPASSWEYPVRKQKSGYTYFFPLDDSMVGKEIEVVLLGMKNGGKDLTPSVWLTARELPFQSSIAE